MPRANGDIWVGDVIEFRSQPESNGIIVSLLNTEGKTRDIVPYEERSDIRAMVIHQSCDSKFAAWSTANLPADFVITPRDTAH